MMQYPALYPNGKTEYLETSFILQNPAVKSPTGLGNKHTIY